MNGGRTVRNKARVLKGRIKRGLGRATGNQRLKSEGRADQIAGNLRQAIGKARNAFRH
jgi:uncharacterized protein YjbJ (UPF0337 family)